MKIFAHVFWIYPLAAVSDCVCSSHGLLLTVIGFLSCQALLDYVRRRPTLACFLDCSCVLPTIYLLPLFDPRLFPDHVFINKSSADGSACLMSRWLLNRMKGVIIRLLSVRDTREPEVLEYCHQTCSNQPMDCLINERVLISVITVCVPKPSDEVKFTSMIILHTKVF